MSLGRNLLLALHDRKMTQTELAAEAGCAQSLISQYISGAKNPSLTMLVKIADALGCTLDELVRDPQASK